MYLNCEDIKDAITYEEELARLLPMIDDIAIIEYDGSNIDCSRAFAQYLDENGIDKAAVDRIVLLGSRTPKTSANQLQLNALYPKAKITIYSKYWPEVDPRKLMLCNTLVLHMGVATGMTAQLFDNKQGSGAKFVDIVNKTRVAYYASILINKIITIFDGRYVIRMNLRLEGYAKDLDAETKPLTNYCKDKQDYINLCMKTLIEKDAFFQCIDESEHGCEECPQCGNYGPRKHCPFAQRAVAKFYREGIYVPQDQRIAHQWELMAARQDYKPARIQMADDLKEGYGCKKDRQAALEIYSMYASQTGNEHCVNQIIQIAQEDATVKRIIAIPFIAQQAKEGNEDMILRLSDAFQNGEYGLPKDPIQQKKWIEQGAENGNPRFVKAMAQLYEASEDWDNSYKWYLKLSEVAPQLLDEGKLDTIEILMLTDGASPQDVTNTGEHYLYGYFGKGRDLHLAYQCLKYGADNGIAKAKGLLGVMYLEGLEVESNVSHAIDLLHEAAQGGDLLSMDKLIDAFLDEDLGYAEGEEYIDVICDRIEEGIANDNAFAYYLKAHYLSIGFRYTYNEYEAFKYMSQAAVKNIPIAQYRLSLMYEKGIGTDCNQRLSDLWLKKSAENGCFEAQGKYGVSLFESASYYDRARKVQAFKYLKSAYDQGYEDAYWCLAQCYMNGYGTDVNKALAYPLHEQAAANGIVAAQELLCEKYYYGDGEFLENDYNLCAKWGEEAIKQGAKSIRFETAYALSHTGNTDRAKEIYLELSNEGNTAAMNNYACELSDVKERAEWFKKAADLGNDYGMWNIAKYYKNGTGVEKDINKALEMFTKSAEKGHSGAMWDLARMYRYGDSVEQNGETAIEWYKKAAEKGETECLAEIAAIYRDGKIVQRDIDKAVHYYKLAAEKGNSGALCSLGKLYEYGTGVEKNIHKAIYWYRKAANKGDNDAKNCLIRLNSNWLGEDGNADDSVDDDDTNF